MLLILFCIICFVCALYSWVRSTTKSGAEPPTCPGRLPIVGHALMFYGDSSHLWNAIVKASEECTRAGGVLKIVMGPVGDYIAATDPDDCATILNSCKEKHYVFSFAKPWLGDGLLTGPALKWKVHRKLLQPIFNQQILNGFISVFNKRARRLIEMVDEHNGKGPFDHLNYLLTCGLETICETTMGIDLGDQSSDTKEYLQAIEEMMNLLVCRFSSVWLHSDHMYNWSLIRRKQDRVLKIIHHMSNKVIQRRKAQIKQALEVNEETGEFRSLLDHILRLTMDKEELSDTEIREHIDTFIVTGYDTSALALCYTLMLLGSHQDVQLRAHKELEEVFENVDRDVEKQDLSKLVYIEAIIKEAIRLYPITPILARYNYSEVQLKNYTIPAESNCFVSVWGLHRHPAWGPDAEQFRPERWLEPGALPDCNMSAMFGMGRRNCIGKTYALSAIKTTLSHLLRRYHITSDVSKLVLKMEVLLKPASGHRISIQRRI